MDEILRTDPPRTGAHARSPLLAIGALLGLVIITLAICATSVRFLTGETSGWQLPKIDLGLGLGSQTGSTIDAIEELIPSRAQQSPEVFANADHGNTIAEVMAGIRDEEYEILAVFDQNETKLVEYSSHSTRQVVLPEEALASLEQAEQLTFVHNHPDDGRNATFSTTDLVEAARCEVAQTIVVSGDYIYSIRPGAGGWPDYRLIRNYGNSFADQWKTDEAGGMFMVEIEVDDDGRRIASLKSTDELIKAFVAKFGLIYTIERVEPDTSDREPY